jgi:hypothetical protein
MALSVTVTKVRRVVATGRIYVHFADGPILDFANFQEVKDWAKDIDIDAGQARDLLRKMAAQYYLARDPTGANPSIIEGKTMTLDLTSNTPLVVS